MMMASLNLSLAWSVPVPVEILGAHLQAHVQLQPTINTIRLCNRFGKGTQAAITKLPIEIITEIEEYLTADEREKQRQNWQTDFRCFEGICKPIEHLSDSEQVGLWLDVNEAASCCSDCDGYHGCEFGRETEALTKEQKNVLETVLDEDLRDEGPRNCAWWMAHENRVERWEGKTGYRHGRDRGLLSTYAPLLLRNFGLEVWVRHQQTSEDDGQISESDVFCTTIAYLTLPCGSARDDLKRAYSELNDMAIGMPYLSSENSGFVDVAMPRELTKADIFRFSRAVKMLGLSPISFKDTKSQLYASSADKGTCAESGSKVQLEEKAKVEEGNREEEKGEGGEAAQRVAKNITDSHWVPKLRVLYSQSTDEEY